MVHSLHTKQEMRVAAFFVLSITVLAPEMAFAQGNNALEQTVSGGLCQVVDAIRGDVGKAISTMAILILGIGAFFGKVNWGLAVMFAAGIVAIFGAAEIAGTIAEGSGASKTAACSGGSGGGSSDG